MGWCCWGGKGGGGCCLITVSSIWVFMLDKMVDEYGYARMYVVSALIGNRQVSLT